MVTDGYDSPVGSLAERCSDVIPPGLWNVGLGYGIYYLLSNKYPAYHTGADIALEPYGGYGQPIYAIANGVVTFSKDVIGTTWRNLVIVQHSNADGSTLCSRYAHLKVRLVKAGDTVLRGQQIGELGNANGAFSPHLHLDAAPGNTLVTTPTNWPGNDMATVRRLYVDIIAYIRGRRPMFEDQIIALANQMATLAQAHKNAPPPTTPMYVIANVTNLRIRSAPAGDPTSIVGFLKTGDVVGKVGEQPDWTKILTPVEGYVSTQYLSAARPL